MHINDLHPTLSPNPQSEFSNSSKHVHIEAWRSRTRKFLTKIKWRIVGIRALDVRALICLSIMFDCECVAMNLMMAWCMLLGIVGCNLCHGYECGMVMNLILSILFNSYYCHCHECMMQGLGYGYDARLLHQFCYDYYALWNGMLWCKWLWVIYYCIRLV